jgi:DNA-directed RNA polymerase subunit M
MMFCPKCGSILKPLKEGARVMWVCSCGYRTADGKIEISEKMKKQKEIEVVEEKAERLPVTEELCPKCGNDKAYFWSKQTRAADEPETRFYRCVKCGHTWREYS